MLLYRDRVIGISNLNEQLTYEEQLPLVWHLTCALCDAILTCFGQKPNEEIRGLTADPVRKTYWVYTDQSLFELVVTNEHRDVWKIYLEKGKYDLALQYTAVRQCPCAPTPGELTLDTDSSAT